MSNITILSEGKEFQLSEGQFASVLDTVRSELKAIEKRNLPSIDEEEALAEAETILSAVWASEDTTGVR